MKQIAYNLSRWMMRSGPDSDIVISSRARAARNLQDHPFPCLASADQTEQVLKKVMSATEGKAEFADFHYLLMDQLSELEKQALVEKHLASMYLVKESIHGALFLRSDEDVSLMVNEEDHLRIQAILAGLQLEEAWNEVGKLDDSLENNFEYAFNDKYGYLTACPTNIGTGLRASVMMHLPALVMTRQIGRYLGALSQVGLMVRGLYGEGTEIVGSLVQISNQVTLGQNEEEIITNLSSVIRQVIDQEQNARQALLDKKRDELSDKAWRALGVLQYSRIMGFQEAIQLISDLRLGHDLGLINKVDYKLLNELLVLVRPGCLQLMAGKKLSNREKNLERPVRVREALDRHLE